MKLPTKAGTDRSQQPVAHRLYFAMPGEQQVRSLVDLWRRYERGEAFQHGQKAWWDLFEHLSDIRPWGPSDRFDERTRAGFREDLVAFPDQAKRMEIELIYRRTPEQQAAAAQALRAHVVGVGGRVVDEREIGDILYHALLVELPAAAMAELLEHPEEGLAAVDEAMLLLPQTLAAVTHEDAEPIRMAAQQRPPLREAGPIVALLDGMPLQGHVGLADRLVVDDPDDHEALYEAHERVHGTQMASLILDGDGHAPTPVSHRLYVRPVMVPGELEETLPPDRLAVYEIYRALQRMLVGEAGENVPGQHRACASSTCRWGSPSAALLASSAPGRGSSTTSPSTTGC